MFDDHVKVIGDGAFFSQLMQMKDGYTDGHKGKRNKSINFKRLKENQPWDIKDLLYISRTMVYASKWNENGDGGILERGFSDTYPYEWGSCYGSSPKYNRWTKRKIPKRK